eukprot:Transcript_31949.p1 GENE.Transcript_31949~~Transcript_31949.p1  ORF type:complete len:393 (+),score=156.97 Transcript_31949:805-1983(+)
MVEQQKYFETVRAVEAAGVCTRFPHPSQLYQQLLSKEWQPALCLMPQAGSRPAPPTSSRTSCARPLVRCPLHLRHPCLRHLLLLSHPALLSRLLPAQLRVPPATMVNRASVMAAPRRAARLACAALAQVRAARYEKKAEPEALRVPEGESRKGVAKLGYAWEAAHVRVFRGESQLASALAELCAQPGVTAAHVIVQDFARNDFELRQFIVGGKVVHRVYSNFAWVDTDGYMREFVMKERADAVRDWLEGDEAAMSAAERRAAKLTASWLTWLHCQSCEALPAVRMDMLVKRTAPGSAEVFTLELTELGFSMLAWPQGPPTVFGALLESCLADTGPTPAEAARFGFAADEAEASAVGVEPLQNGEATSKRQRVGVADGPGDGHPEARNGTVGE